MMSGGSYGASWERAPAFPTESCLRSEWFCQKLRCKESGREAIRA